MYVLRHDLVEYFRLDAIIILWIRSNPDLGRVRQSRRIDLKVGWKAIDHEEWMKSCLCDDLTLLLHGNQFHQGVIQVLYRDICVVQERRRVDEADILQLLTRQTIVFVLHLRLLLRGVQRIQYFVYGIVGVLDLLRHLGRQFEHLHALGGQATRRIAFSVFFLNRFWHWLWWIGLPCLKAGEHLLRLFERIKVFVVAMEVMADLERSQLVLIDKAVLLVRQSRLLGVALFQCITSMAQRISAKRVHLLYLSLHYRVLVIRVGLLQLAIFRSEELLLLRRGSDVQHVIIDRNALLVILNLDIAIDALLLLLWDFSFVIQGLQPDLLLGRLGGVPGDAPRRLRSHLILLLHQLLYRFHLPKILLTGIVIAQICRLRASLRWRIRPYFGTDRVVPLRKNGLLGNLLIAYRLKRVKPLDYAPSVLLRLVVLPQRVLLSPRAARCRHLPSLFRLQIVNLLNTAINISRRLLRRHRLLLLRLLLPHRNELRIVGGVMHPVPRAVLHRHFARCLIYYRDHGAFVFQNLRQLARLVLL